MDYIYRLCAAEKKFKEAVMGFLARNCKDLEAMLRQYENIINHYVQAKVEIIETYESEGVRKVYDELIKYVKDYTKLYSG